MPHLYSVYIQISCYDQIELRCISFLLLILEKSLKPFIKMHSKTQTYEGKDWTLHTECQMLQYALLTTGQHIPIVKHGGRASGYEDVSYQTEVKYVLIEKSMNYVKYRQTHGEKKNSWEHTQSHSGGMTHFPAQQPQQHSKDNKRGNLSLTVLEWSFPVQTWNPLNIEFSKNSHIFWQRLRASTWRMRETAKV